MMASDPVDPGNFSREPTHAPGTIQPHGAMLVCEADATTIAFASANAAALLGLGDAPLLDRSLIDVFGVDAAHELRNALSKGSSMPVGGTLSGLRLGAAAFDVVAHRHDGRFIIEFEPAHGPVPGGDALDLTQAMIRRIALESSVDALAVAGARLVRTTLGYDRVMVYRFLSNDAGRVIAESKRSDMNSYLGQQCPAADIPAQARGPDLQSWIRVIGDATDTPVPLLAGKSAQPGPVDMSYSHLRSVSPIRCEYLRSMGVAASLSISIVIDGELWGVIACHHESPRTVSLPMRVAAEMFGQYFSLQLTIAQRDDEMLEAERTRTEQRRRILNDELNHRVKNILALVKSIAVQTGAHAANVAEYSASLEGRLRALSYAHDQSLILGSRGELSALLDAEASPLRYGVHDRVKLSGPRIGFTDNAFSSFALVIHEMMTNAAKYGALSVPKGRLSIEWMLDADGACIVDWSENDGPEVFAPSRKGFGSTLVASSMTYDLGGSVSIDYAVHGLQARFSIPARHVMQLQGDAVLPRAAVIVARPLAGLNVLLLEDRALIAIDTENILYQLGAASVDAFPNVAAASRGLAAAEPDLAILDFNLGDETSADLADWFASRRIPFVFLTGYIDSASIPLRFAAIPVIRKPVDIDRANEALAQVLGR
jgi:light-regulated signal transduction histidine kinase (bacteriophytochrome)/CheY-like chemotaxis protein